MNAFDRKHSTVSRCRLVMKRLLTLGAGSIAVLVLIVMPVAGQAPQAEKNWSGATLKITYREQGVDRIATRIEVADATKK